MLSPSRSSTSSAARPSAASSTRLPSRLEHPPHELAQRHLVLDDQHRRAPGSGSGSRSGVDHRQGDRDLGALPRRAVDLDLAARGVDDAVHRRQPEAGALARLLGGEERLEDARARRLVHADAGVAPTREHGTARLAAGVVDLDGRDGEPAAATASRRGR